MATFRQLYCEKHHCRPEQFSDQIFWTCLYPQARPVAAVLLLLRQRRFFAPDRALIESVAGATSLRKVREEVRDYFWDSNNRRWLRRVGKLRVSGQRVKNVARRFLPESEPTDLDCLRP